MTSAISPPLENVRGTIKPKKQLPENVTDGREVEYCYLCGRLRWVWFNLTLHEENIEYPFEAPLCGPCGRKAVKDITKWQPVILRKYRDDGDRFIADFPCNDCKVNCLEIGDWYLARHTIWEDKLGLGWTDNLCIACLEKRLGRRLKRGWMEVGPAPTWYRRHPPTSERLCKLWRPPQKRGGPRNDRHVREDHRTRA